MNILLRMYPGDACTLLIVSVLVQVAVVSLTAGLVARLGTRWNAAWRYSVYCVAIVCVLSSPLLSYVMQATGMAMVTLRPSTRAAASAEPAQMPMAQVAQASLEPLPVAPLLAESSPPPQAEILRQEARPASPAAHSLPDILRAFAAVGLMTWLLGMALLLVRWCYGLRLIALLRRTSQPLDCAAMAAVLHEVRRNLGVERLPPLAVSVHLDRPVMVGLVRPLVILPENLLRTLRGPELGDVLVHECAHVICRHQAVGLLQRLAGILFWPHPLVHFVNAQLAQAREEVCDNYVLRRRAAPRYARTLLELSQLLVNPSPQPTALGLFPCRWRLEDRVASLLDRRRKAMVRISRWTAAALAATFLSLALAIAGVQVVQAEPKESKPGKKPAAERQPSGKQRPAKQPEKAQADNFGLKWRLWVAYDKGLYGYEKNPKKARELLAELVQGVYLASFRPAVGFAPKTPRELLNGFYKHRPALPWDENGVGGASMFLAHTEDGTLIGSFLTVYPDQLRKAINDNPLLELVSIEKVTPEMFVERDALYSESFVQRGVTDSETFTLPVSGTPAPIAFDSYFRLGYNTTLAFVMEADVNADDPRNYQERDGKIAAAIQRRYNERGWHWSIGDGSPQHQLFRQGTLRAQADLTLARKKGSDAKQRVEAVYQWWDTTTKWTAEDWKARQGKIADVR